MVAKFPEIVKPKLLYDQCFREKLKSPHNRIENPFNDDTKVSTIMVRFLMIDEAVLEGK